jgi:hypothetical protein
MIFSELTEENFLLFAIKHYENPQAVTKEDFDKDFIILYNIFGDATTPMLFFKIETDLWSVVKTFIIFLNRLAETPRCYVHDVPVDIHCLKELQNLCKNG